jgi:hypothetical protein
MSLDLAKLHEWTTPSEINEALLKGGVPSGYEKPVGNYPYQYDELELDPKTLSV